MTGKLTSASGSVPGESSRRCGSSECAVDDRDRYKAAVDLVLQHQRASVALVQRHLRLGYAEACTLFERMEADGIVTPVVAAGRVWTLSHAYRSTRKSATDRAEVE